MDAIIISLFAIALSLYYRSPKDDQGMCSELVAERITPNTALNPEMIHDEHAFMEIANELGFH